MSSCSLVGDATTATTLIGVYLHRGHSSASIPNVFEARSDHDTLGERAPTGYSLPETGAVNEVWMVDVKFEHADGRVTRVRKVSPVQTRRGAEQYERDVRDSLLQGSYGRKEEAPKRTFSELAREFLSVYAKANNKPSEVAAKEWILRLHLEPVFGRKRLDEISPRDFEVFKAKKLADGLAPKTVYNHLACLNKLLRVAADWGWLEVVPRLKTVKVAKPAFDFLDFDEAERLVEAADGQIRVMTTVALNTGLRIGEMRALRWEDVDLVVGRIMVRRSVYREDKIGTPKSGQPREIPLNSVALASMKGHRHLRGQLVFCQEDGRMLRETETHEPLATACKRAGIRRIGWHTLRHTFASHLVMRGQPPKAVQELLGHATIEMTMRYAHLTPDVRKDAVEALTPKGHIRGTTARAK